MLRLLARRIRHPFAVFRRAGPRGRSSQQSRVLLAHHASAARDYLAIVTLGFGEIIRNLQGTTSTAVKHHQRAAGITLIDPRRSVAHRSANLHLGGITIAPVHSYYFVFLAW